MPTLDMSDVLLSPEFADRFTLIRRTESVSSKGETVIQEWPTANVIGVFTAASPNQLERLDDHERTQRCMSLITKTQIQSSSYGRQPDMVDWANDRYIVRLVEPYTRYGRGFVQTLILAIDAQQSALDLTEDYILLANVLDQAIHVYIPEGVLFIYTLEETQSMADLLEEVIHESIPNAVN